MVTGRVEINYSQFPKFYNRGSPRGSNLPSQAKSTFKFECSVPRLYFSGVPTAWKGSQQTRLLYFPSVSKILDFSVSILSHQKISQVCLRKKEEKATALSYTLYPSWEVSLSTDTCGHYDIISSNLLTHLKKHFWRLTVPTKFDSVISRISESFNSLAV